MSHSWQEKELQLYLQTNRAAPLLNVKNVFLSNPEQRKQIDQKIINDIFPNIDRALKGTPVKVSLGKDGDIADCIEEEWKPYTTRSLLFLLEDPERPLLPGVDISWFCRGEIECSAVGYMIVMEFHIFFPESFSLKKIMKLLKDPAFAGMRPQFDYQDSSNGVGVYAVKFERGKGASGPVVDSLSAGNQIYNDVKANLEVIYALNDLETDYKSTKLFNRLHRSLVNAYEAN